jgi:hypothetical protein
MVVSLPSLSDDHPHIPRGRSPVPRGRLVHSRESSPPPCPSLDEERSDSPDLIFPMSPVSCDSKGSSLSFPIQEPRSSPAHMHIDLKLPDPATRKSQRLKENIPTIPKLELPRRRKAEPLAPVDPNTIPPSPSSKSTKTSKSTTPSPFMSRRLASFLRPSVPAVTAIATPTAVTVRRSSQDGTSSLVMEESVATSRLPDASQPSKPIEIAVPRAAPIALGPRAGQCIPHPILVTGRGREHNVDGTAKLRKKASYHHIGRARPGTLSNAGCRKSSQHETAPKMAILFTKQPLDQKMHECNNTVRPKGSET